MTKQRKILLVEPDSILGSALKTALEGSGFKVSHVLTAQEAVIVADAKTPDLVILELQLVSHSGIEFLCEFRSYSDWDQIPVVIYSSVPPTEFAASREGIAMELGVVKYLYKAVASLSDLIGVVKEQFSNATKLDTHAAAKK